MSYTFTSCTTEQTTHAPHQFLKCPYHARVQHLLAAHRVGQDVVQRVNAAHLRHGFVRPQQPNGNQCGHDVRFHQCRLQTHDLPHTPSNTTAAASVRPGALELHRSRPRKRASVVCHTRTSDRLWRTDAQHRRIWSDGDDDNPMTVMCTRVRIINSATVMFFARTSRAWHTAVLARYLQMAQRIQSFEDVRSTDNGGDGFFGLLVWGTYVCAETGLLSCTHGWQCTTHCLFPDTTSASNGITHLRQSACQQSTPACTIQLRTAALPAPPTPPAVAAPLQPAAMGPTSGNVNTATLASRQQASPCISAPPRPSGLGGRHLHFAVYGTVL